MRRAKVWRKQLVEDSHALLPEASTACAIPPGAASASGPITNRWRAKDPEKKAQHAMRRLTHVIRVGRCRRPVFRLG